MAVPPGKLGWAMMKQALQAIVDQLVALELQIGLWIAPFTPIIVPMI